MSFHMESPWDVGTKVGSNGPGQMTKMAAMPIYGKNLEKFTFVKMYGKYGLTVIAPRQTEGNKF